MPLRSQRRTCSKLRRIRLPVVSHHPAGTPPPSPRSPRLTLCLATENAQGACPKDTPSEHTINLMSMPAVRLAKASDGIQLAEMRSALWPETLFEEHLKEVETLLRVGICGNFPLAILAQRTAGGSMRQLTDFGDRAVVIARRVMFEGLL